MTNEQMFRKMVEAQDELNTLIIGENWTEIQGRPLKWKMYAVAEAIELLESTESFYHWKQNKEDLNNQFVELIDIIFFNISKDLASGYGYVGLVTEMKLAYKQAQSDGLIIGIYGAVDFYLKARSDRDYWYALFTIAKILDKSLEDVYRGYMTKLMLNKFRTLNGYKDGKYIKSWNGKEDNVVAFEIANQLELNENFEEVLYGKLELAYSAVVGE